MFVVCLTKQSEQDSVACCAVLDHHVPQAVPVLEGCFEHVVVQHTVASHQRIDAKSVRVV